MLFLQKPKNPHLYCIVNSEQSQILHKNNFIPKYFYDNMYYYVKTKELIEFMEGGERFWQKN